jgi:hypothetical protein
MIEAAGSAIDRLRGATTGRMLLSNLLAASATLEDDALVIGVAQAQIAFLESERDALATNAHKAFGRKLRIVFKPGGQDEVDDSIPERPRPARPAPVEAKPTAPVTPTAGAKTPNKAALKSRAMADPMVERTLDLFGGTLLDVKPLDPPLPAPDEASGE